MDQYPDEWKLPSKRFFEILMTNMNNDVEKARSFIVGIGFAQSIAKEHRQKGLSLDSLISELEHLITGAGIEK